MRKKYTIIILTFILVNLVHPISLAGNTYRDGAYIGYVPSRNGDVVIKVEINNNKINDVKILTPVKKKGEYPHLPSVKLFKKYPKLVVQKQSATVDTITGATISYNNYKEAVNMALNIASGEYADNIYYGISKDYEDDGYALLQVIIADEEIKDIKIIPAKDSKKEALAQDKTDGYPYSPASKVYKRFPKLAVKKQSTYIDTLSGATYSLKAYNLALKQALKQAGLNPVNY